MGEINQRKACHVPMVSGASSLLSEYRRVFLDVHSMVDILIHQYVFVFINNVISARIELVVNAH